jgi:hypothetical protein
MNDFDDDTSREDFQVEGLLQYLLSVGCTPDEVFSVHMSILEMLKLARQRRRNFDNDK